MSGIFNRMSHEQEEITRRQTLAAGVAGATLSRLPDDRRKMPVVYLPHGGGPWPFVELGFPRHEVDALAAYLRELPAALPDKPRALLVVSAHWEERVPTVMTSARPPMLYDYYGFPPASYEIQWPAPGAPELASRVRSLLAGAGIESAEDSARGFDHGTFVPLKLAFPDADIPTAQLSLAGDLDPARHVAIGRALAPLRDEGVLIVASGMSFHNLRAMRDPRAGAISREFDAWLEKAATAAPADRSRALEAWEAAPAARAAHPREEHLIPLMVAAGAAGDDRGALAYRGTFMGCAVSAFHYGGVTLAA